MHLKCNFEVMELSEEKIAVPVGDNAGLFHGVIKMNETAAYILELLKKESSEAEIIEAMMAEFNAPRGILEKDVRQYIEEFTEMGLIAE